LATGGLGAAHQPVALCSGISRHGVEGSRSETASPPERRKRRLHAAVTQRATPGHQMAAFRRHRLGVSRQEMIELIEPPDRQVFSVGAAVSRCVSVV
jgi:hypothetical protein